LGLHDNLLTGTIPSVLASLSDLHYLWFGHNELSGQIPESLLMGLLAPFFSSARVSGEASPSVKLLNVSGNEFLQGTVPDAVWHCLQLFQHTLWVFLRL